MKSTENAEMLLVPISSNTLLQLGDPRVGAHYSFPVTWPRHGSELQTQFTVMRKVGHTYPT